jgi:hypothetical protein
MGADKNYSRRRLKLRQDEPARSDPQNHKLRTSTFRLPTPRSHWSATGPRNKLYQQPQHTRTHDSRNTSKAGCLEGAVRPPPPGNQEILRNTSSEHQNAPRFHQKRSLVKATSYQKILAKTETPPRGLGAVRLATRGGLTSCTHQRTPTKNT